LIVVDWNISDVSDAFALLDDSPLAPCWMLGHGFEYPEAEQYSQCGTKERPLIRDTVSVRPPQTSDFNVLVSND